MPRHAPPRRIAKRSRGCAAALLGVLLQSQAAADVALTSPSPTPGLVALPDPFVPTLPFLAPEPATADVLRSGAWRLEAAVSVANQWAHERGVERYLNARSPRSGVTLEELRALEPREGSGLFYLDGEIRQLTVELRRGLGRNLEAALTIPVRWAGGGLADPLADPFHDTLGFDDAGRSGVPSDHYTVYVRSDRAGAPPFEIFTAGSPGAMLGDLTLAIKRGLPVPGRWKLALEGAVELPTGGGDRMASSDATDLGLQAAASVPVRRGWLHATIGLAQLGASDVWRSPAQLTWRAFAGFEHRLGAASHFAVQLSLVQSPLRHLDLPELSRVATVIDLALKRRIGERRTLVLGWSDSQFAYQNSADFALHVALHQEWGAPGI